MNLKLSRKTSPKVNLSYSTDSDPFLKQFIIRLIEFPSGRRKLEKLYEQILEEDPAPIEIWGAALEKMSINLKFDEKQLKKVPQTGPVVFIANHPFGVVDGLALGYLVSKVRKDFTVIVNEVLCREERLSQYLLPIDFRATKEAMQINIDTRKQSMERLKNGETIAIFPSGGVATAKGFFGKVEDLEWKRFVAKMIQMTKATVIPLFVHGQNSRLFQIVSQVSLTLRLSLLMNEARNKVGKDIPIEVGDPLYYKDLEKIKDRQELVNFLRKTTEELEYKNFSLR